MKEFSLEVPGSPLNLIHLVVLFIDKEAEIIGQDCVTNFLGLDLKIVRPVSWLSRAL